jgi:chromosomal replication initiator protein
MLKPLSIRSIARSSACGITIEDIQGAVAEQFDVDVVDLKRKSNHHAIVVPRQIAMYLSWLLTAASLTKIGRSFGGKHHTTVMYSIQKVAEQHLSNKNLNVSLEKLQNLLRREWAEPDG